MARFQVQEQQLHAAQTRQPRVVLAGLALIGLVKVNVDGLERGEEADKARRRPQGPDDGPSGGAPRRQSRDLRDPRRLE